MTVKSDIDLLRFEIGLCQSLAKGFDTPRALTVSLLLAHSEFQQLLDLQVNPDHYLNVDSFAIDLQITEMMKKNPRLPTGINKKEVAIGKFYDAERLCSDTNLRMQKFREDPYFAGRDMCMLFLRIQHIIQRILSAYPTRFDLDFAERHMRFGPGATTSLKGVVTQGAKFKHRTLDCTPSLVSFRAFCFPELWKQSVKDLRVVDSSRLTTVPKNAKTDRVICIEPDLNIFVQLGLGALLREKLRRFGLDLNTQENNQRMASRAVRDNLCTVDLASASDTISYEVVSLLLPPAWVELLEYPRVASTIVDGQPVVLSKWSSMGNGYTFELETLIFYATALAVTSEDRWDDVISYGDDIILPIEGFPDLSKALDFLGFRVNADKTFGKGLFRESCGTDWFNGVNVRPFYLRTTHHDFESICYLYANIARRWANRRNGGWSCDVRCLPFWLRCFHAVRPEHVHHIPEGYGDVGFVSDFDRASPTTWKDKSGWQGYRFFYRRIGAVEKVISQEGCYLSFLSGRISQFALAKEGLRGRYRRAVKSVGFSSDWPTLGPWL